MIKKTYRLSENEVKKVLRYGKPFFSYTVVANHIKNNFPYNRFAIVIGGKSVSGAICRNFFRRTLYNLVRDYITPKQNEASKDITFVLKKQIKLDKNDFESIKTFEKDISFLLKKL